MEHNLLKWATICCIALSALTGCKKDLKENFVQTTKGSKNTLTPYGFDWETGDYMPTPSGVSILKPWASGSNQSFPLIYTTDIKKSDGWELVYNTFSPTEFIQPAYFVLYNRYRGLLRAYFYLTPTSPIPSSYISHTLIQRTAGTDAPTLTFSGNSAQDLSITQNNTNLTQAYKTTATGTWYAAEYEMAYDPQVHGKDANSNQITWQLNSINASDLAINGTSQGGINGTIAQPKPPGPSLFGSIVSGALDFVGFKALGSYVVKLATKDDEKSVVKSLQDAAKAGLTGQVKNIANGIFGGASSGGDSTKQYVHLTTNTSYNLTGSITDSYTLANPSMVIPGSSGQENVTGYAPVYRKALGIMNLSAAPTAHCTIYNSIAPGNSGYYYELKLNMNSFNVVWNPDIVNSDVNGVSIQNIKREILAYENYYDDGYNPVWPANLTEFDGFNKYLKNDIAVDNYIRIQATNSCYGCDHSDSIPVDTFTEDQKLPRHVLRISFDVVPNNGSPKVTIAKSFNIILKGPIDNIVI
ncbi:hypothetical protein [Mucilaginibacter polytrichastri]|uniref:Uncharacterized protein n=1 Tax=Mucilaginibacter polytrichastri TaxID=1302689 RepID=A0A1Q5ZWC4_9SPHI|nr:hypothetical protein [Mucilaginibacter polytrichastri]OKS86065.1 hypothetical protein RG47T_1512 [Mucilaginibacter polytrichastri]SFS59191.1 hypothetical protein SAMN04487890_10276 [Mucilaginibacter polytrichastri]